jgi:starch synthase
LFEAMQRVAATYRDKALWQQLQRNGMRKDFSWQASAIAYRDIYQSLVTSSHQVATLHR